MPSFLDFLDSHSAYVALAAGFLSFIFGAVCCTPLTKLLLRWNLRYNLLDHPNQRSLHNTPTPRGGGIAIVLVFYFTSAILWILKFLDCKSVIALLCGVPIALIGLLDDFRSQSIRSRLAVQSCCVAAALAVLWPPPTLFIGFFSLPVLVAGLFYWLFALWCINLFNFMDGIDGLLSGQALVIGLLWATMLPLQDALIALALAGSAFGFLRFNWPPARIFLGDAGSYFLGFACAVLPMLFSAHTQRPWAIWIIPLLLLITDASATLIVRVIRGFSPGTAHRCHVYQRLAQRFGQHKPVTVGYMILCLAGLGPLFIFANLQPHHSTTILFLCGAILSCLAFILKAGHDYRK